MNPMDADNHPEEFARYQADQRRRMLEARAMVYVVHSRTGMLTRLLRDLAHGVDPSGDERSKLRRR